MTVPKPITIIAPLRVPRTKTKMFTLNMNVYRNTHYHVLNKTKIEYKKAIQEQLDLVSPMQKVKLTFTLYPKTKRLCDISNILSIHDKYFCDALVEAEKLTDDNYQYLTEIVYKFGNIDKDNPRVEIQIEPL